MIRDPELCDNGAQQHTDRVLAQADGEATRWVSSEDHKIINASIYPGESVTQTYPAQKCGAQPADRLYLRPIQKTDGAGCVVLERKFGGQTDDQAEIVKTWELGADIPSVNVHTTQSGRGFFRLRVAADYSMPLLLFIQSLKHNDF